MPNSKFRRPEPNEQRVLDGLVVRPIKPKERARYQALMIQHHYLHDHQLVGEQLCYVATYRGEWLGLISWCAAARYLKARDQFIGWTPEQCRRRRGLIANNARFLILPEGHYPNLASRMLRLVLARLSDDWLERYGHPIVLVETFVDPEQFRGTTYKCSGWMELGRTQGWARCGQDFYVAHQRPKQLWVKELVKQATVRLRSQALPDAWAIVEAAVPVRCTVKSAAMKALTDHLAQIPEYRSAHALAYPLCGMLALIAVATFCGVARGKKDLAAFAQTLTRSQLRALRFRTTPKGQGRRPGVTTFFRILNQVDETAVERALLAWQDQILGPVPDRVFAVDGKALRHSQGGEVVSLIGTESGRWLGSVRTPDKSNEIPAARTLLERVNQRVDLSNKLVVLDALHTNQETARQVVQELGADYLLTVKANQGPLHERVGRLLQPSAFSPSGSDADRATAGTQPQSAGVPPPAPPEHHA
jgi:predicted transposase YbfD/YdcC